MLPAPIIAVVIGEGGSGGALALGVADRVLMLENSVYSVISPEGCAAILWKDASAARARRRGAQAHRRRPARASSVIDEIIPEPVGGAHFDPDAAGEALRDALIRHLAELRKLKPGQARQRRAREVRGDGGVRGRLMPQTVEVRFKGNRRDFFDWSDDAAPLRLNEPVVVAVERGFDLGRVNAVGEAALAEVRRLHQLRHRCTGRRCERRTRRRPGRDRAAGARARHPRRGGPPCLAERRPAARGIAAR